MEEISRPFVVLSKEGSTKLLRTKAKEALEAHEMEMKAMAEDSDNDQYEEALEGQDDDEEEEEGDEE